MLSSYDSINLDFLSALRGKYITLGFFLCVCYFQRLGERWTAVCRWTEEQWLKLQEINTLWEELLEEQVSDGNPSHSCCCR